MERKGLEGPLPPPSRRRLLTGWDWIGKERLGPARPAVERTSPSSFEGEGFFKNGMERREGDWTGEERIGRPFAPAFEAAALNRRGSNWIGSDRTGREWIGVDGSGVDWLLEPS